jgi:hypothetical protein
MSVFRHRRVARVVAALLLFGAMRGLAHPALDDTACAPAALEHHDESKHAIGAAVADEHQHCAICHWSRTVRSPLGTAAAFLAPQSAASLLPQLSAGVRRALALDNLPARAPPAALRPDATSGSVRRSDNEEEFHVLVHVRAARERRCGVMRVSI